VDGVHEDGAHLVPRVRFRERTLHVGQGTQRDEEDHCAHGGEQEEGRMPFEAPGQPESAWHAEYGGEGKRGHHGRHRAAAPLGWDDIADHGGDD